MYVLFLQYKCNLKAQHILRDSSWCWEIFFISSSVFSVLVACAMMLYQLAQSHSYWRLFVTQKQTSFCSSPILYIVKYSNFHVFRNSQLFLS